MRNLIIVTLSFWLGSGLYAQDVWIKRDSVNGPPRGACAAFALNGEGFIATGVNIEEFKRRMYSYDLEQDDWDNEESLGGDAGVGLERASAIGFSARGYGYVGLGSGAAAYMKDLWRYDPETETWTQMADFAGSARRGAVAFEIDHIAYVGSGQDEEGLTSDFYKYDAELNEWEEIAEFEGGARREAVGFRMGGKGYFGTGRGASTYYADFWEYNPISDEWTEKAEFPGTPRMGAVGCGVFPSAFIMLGEDNSFEYREDVWEYNFFGNIWTQRADYAGGTRSQASAFVVDDRIFVGLGYNGSYHDDFYEYEQILSVVDNKLELSISVFPNPSNGNFQIQYPAGINPSIEIYNSAGQNITALFEIIRQNGKFMISANEIVAGNYFINFFDQNEFLFTKQIILHP